MKRPLLAKALAIGPFLLFLAVVEVNLVVVTFHTALSTDELMARISAQSASLGHLLNLLRDQPVNVDAPLFPVLAFGAARLALPIDFAIRVPSMVAVCIALIAVFSLVRQRLGTPGAYVAALLLAASPYADYGAIARPYALFLAAIACVLLCWVRAAQAEGERRVWLAGLWLSSTLALFSQYLSPLVLVVIWIAELVRSYQRKKMDWAIVIAFGLAAAVFLPLYLSFASGGEPYRLHPYLPLDPQQLTDAYQETIGRRSTLAVLMTGSLFAAATRISQKGRLFSKSEAIAILGLALSAVLIYVVGGRTAHTFHSRYGICSVLGVVLILTACANRFGGGSAKALIPAFIAGFALYENSILQLTNQAPYKPSVPWKDAQPELVEKYSGLPVVTPDFDYAMRIHFYAPGWLASKVVMITSKTSILKFTGTDNPALAALAIHRWIGWPIVDYDTFTQGHSRFLMYGAYWMLDALKADGARVELLGNVGPYPLFLVTARHLPGNALP